MYKHTHNVRWFWYWLFSLSPSRNYCVCVRADFLAIVFGSLAWLQIPVQFSIDNLSFAIIYFLWRLRDWATERSRRQNEHVSMKQINKKKRQCIQHDQIIWSARERKKSHSRPLNNCNCVCGTAVFLHICIRSIKNNSAKPENNEILQWGSQRITCYRHTQSRQQTTEWERKRVTNKSTKVWLNSRSKHKWKLKYKRSGKIIVLLQRSHGQQTHRPTDWPHIFMYNCDFYNWLHFDCVTLNWNTFIHMHTTNIYQNALRTTSTRWPPAAVGEPTAASTFKLIILPSSTESIHSLFAWAHIIAEIIRRTRSHVVIYLPYSMVIMCVFHIQHSYCHYCCFHRRWFFFSFIQQFHRHIRCTTILWRFK